MAEAFAWFLIPWGFLKEQEVAPIKKAYAPQGQRKTFV